MKPKVLMVDDERNILVAYERNLRDLYDLKTVESGVAALDAIKEYAYPVIVTDYQMPVMNGVDLLSLVRENSPDTVQIMLTGQADMQAVVNLINKGKVFRFLTKPCSPEDLTQTIQDALRQYELITAERELLGKTLGGSIRVLTDLLALAKPIAFHRTQRIRSLIKKTIADIQKDTHWQIEIGAMLSQIGCVTIPDDILKKAFGGRMLTDSESIMFNNHPIVAADMIKNIPRLEKVADIIRYQEKYFDGSGYPSDEIAGDKIPIGSRLLKIILDYDKMVNAGNEPENALRDMKNMEGRYDHELLGTTTSHLIQSIKKRRIVKTRDISIDRLDEDMYLAEDVLTASGVILGSKNQKVTKTLKITLKNYEKNKQLKDLINVYTISE